MDGSLYPSAGGLYNHAPTSFPPSLIAPAASGSTSSSAAQSNESGSTSPPSYNPPTAPKRVGGKSNVSSACGPCKRAHLACDVGRPCKRCCNLGKEELCEDVPHKKRGRPKQPKDSMQGPFSRPSVGGSEPEGRWRNPWGGSEPDAPPSQQSYQPYPPLQAPRILEQPSYPPMAYSPAAGTLPFPSPPLFTMFTTTDLRILRCTASSYPLTGFPAQDFINTNLLDWVMPHDRHLLEMEHGRLMANPMSPGQLHSNRETQEAIAHRSEKDLMSPVDGMREPYPNQSVRLMRSDQQYSLFNVRLHLGGGLGGSLWHPETLGKVYFVISLLLLPHAPLPHSIPIGQPISSAGPTRLSVSLGSAEPGPLSAAIARRLSYISPSAAGGPHPLQHQQAASRIVSGANTAASSPFPSGDENSPSAGPSRYNPNFHPNSYLSSMPTPMTYSQPSPHPSHANAGPSPQPPPIYPAPRTPRSDPQVYTLHQAKAEREAHGGLTRQSYSSQGYAAQIQPMQSGYYDPRLMQAYRPPPEAGREWEASAGQEAYGQVQVKTEVEERPVYLHEGQGQGQGRDVDGEVVMGQHAAGINLRSPQAAMQVGHGYGEYDASAWDSAS